MPKDETNSVALQKSPKARDFSKPAIKSALLSHTNSHWTVRYSLPLIAGSLVAGGIFGFTYPVFLSILATSGIGITSWVYNYFVNGNSFEQEYVARLRSIIAEQTENKRKHLNEDLASYGSKRGIHQLDLFQKKFENLIDVLNSKFDSTQLTYSRYYGIAQEVFLSGIDNLSAVVTALKTINTIDVSYLKTRLEELKSGSMENIANVKESEALKRRLRSFKEQKDKISALLAENEEALAQFDETAIAISEIERARDKESKMSMERAMQDLQEMMKRAKHFSN